MQEASSRRDSLTSLALVPVAEDSPRVIIIKGRGLTESIIIIKGSNRIRGVGRLIISQISSTQHRSDSNNN